ncbi:MAG: bifunctional hydroxymethylpyrimidine kinase/phosphomethylpyrimidine kinase [Pseudomonadota bacterium]
MTGKPPRVLAVAGSDSCGSAGIQADIKTITMLGGYAMTAVTAVTAQNTVGVQAVEALPAEIVGQQIDSCLNDIGADAIKIGMLHDVEVVAEVAASLGQIGKAVPIILDPVMVATSGAKLIDDEAVGAMKEALFPLATLITPNLPELEMLSAQQCGTTEEMADAALALASKYGCNVLAKGGHASGDRIVDALVGPDTRAMSFNHARIATRHTHGTGCTLSSAIATLMGHGQPLEHAVRLARKFVFQAIEGAPGYGTGNGPLGHQAVRDL